MWSDQEKKIDRLARSLLIQGLPNDIYSLIDSNKTTKDLYDALARHMLGSEYGEQARKAAVLYEYETFKATEGELLLNTYIRYLQVINNFKKCGYSKDNCELNFKFLNNLQPEWKQYATMMRQNKNLMDINIDALHNILKQNQRDVNNAMLLKKKNVVVTSDPLALIAEKTEEGHFPKDCKKVKVKDYEYYKTKMLHAKKDKDEQVLLAKDQAQMESSSDSDQENANMVFMAQIDKVLSDSEARSSSVDDKISEVSYYLSESKSEFEYETSEYYDNTTTYEIRKFNKNIAKYLKRIEKANQQNKDFENQNKDLQVKYDVLKNQATTFEIKNKELKEQLKVLIEKNDDLLAQTKVLKDQLQVKHVVIDTHVECQEKYAKLEAERYEYMIRYSAYFNNDKQHRKQIADQEVLHDKISVQLVELDKHTVHMIIPSKDTLYNGRKGIGFENPSYFEKAKDLRPNLYDEKVIGLGNNSHLRETSNAYVCNDAMNVSCNSRLYDSFDENNLFIFDDESVSISLVSKTPCRKKPRDSMNIIQICLWIIDSGCSKHMTGNRALLTNFVEKFLGTVRFGNNDFAVIAGYGDMVIGSMTIKKVYYVEGLGHNLFSVEKFCNKASKSPFENEASDVIIYFIKKTQVNLQLQVQRVRTDNGTEFKNKTLANYFDEVGITQQFSAARTPQQNESAAFRIYNKRTHKIYESVNVNFDEISKMASKQFSLELGLSNLNKTGKSSNPPVSQVSETSKKVLEDLFRNFYDEYFDSSKIMKFSTTNVDTFNDEIPSHEEEVFHKSSKSFQEKSSSSSLNDDVQQSSKEVKVPSSNTQSISNNMIPNVDEVSTSHNVFNECLKDAYFDASTSFHDPSNVHTFYQPYPHEKK
nr:integrase, catalytic region, zinc finger, CCHC-type, peptidase aspartic, catalytic [Tanacetum cinerariifolium]